MDLLIQVQEQEELLPGILSVLVLMQKHLHHGSHCPKNGLLVLKREGRSSAVRAEGLLSAQHPLDTSTAFPLGGVSLPF